MGPTAERGGGPGARGVSLVVEQKTPSLFTFTVFTATFNRAHTLHRVYTSLTKQTFSDFEWLVVDDGSTDNTVQLFDE